MRRLLPVLTVAATVAFAGMANAQALQVRVDQAERITLSGSARDVVVGNPAIADVTVVDSRNLIVTGKSFGVTNVIAVDASGRTLTNRQIVVSASDEGRVSFYRGPEVRSYSCSPRCERTDQQEDGASTSAPTQPSSGPQ